ncbi:MAG: stealth family protein [Lachnospiraceae bacterium]|nr:stealth family protein [Lachnospiraceae bacterium]
MDCVILWVDGNDPAWIQEKNKYAAKDSEEGADQRSQRFRDWGTLKYLLRGIEKNAPFFRKIFFVTCGQKPDWLNESHPKLVLVNHKDFIPEKYLPTFNANTIELNLHRIRGLSDRFVYFNDDMFLLQKTTPYDFFKKGRPRDTAVMNAFAAELKKERNLLLVSVVDNAVINTHFQKKEVLKKYFRKFFTPVYGKDVLRNFCLLPWKHFTGFVNYHLPYNLRKKYFFEVWEKEPDLLDRTCSHRFRNADDVNIWLLLYWQICRGDFSPRNPCIGQSFTLRNQSNENINIYDFIRKRKRKIIVINDEITQIDFSEQQEALLKAFDSIFPEKSRFEKY